MHDLPTNIMADKSPDQSPQKNKTAQIMTIPAGDLYRAAYGILIERELAWVKNDIINRVEGRHTSDFPRKVAEFAENPKNIVEIAKFLSAVST